MDFSEEVCQNESESGSQFSDDFDVVEETRLSLSNLSLKRKSKINRISGVDEKDDEEIVGELDDKDKQSYEIIQKMIEGGQVDRLKVDQCKIYLRKHGLRLSGKKDILIERIKEHVDIVNGGGEEKYPASSFVFNCKGDSCKGDVVMFEQNVYDEYSIVSRSAKGGCCGTRIVAGRILKESYGAAKQQHTFTIEVLWSKGEKPLPPLHPLLIKGRNLYKMNTMRQKWDDEGERCRILSEKHARGGAARSERETRIQQKEMQKTQRHREEEKQDMHRVNLKPQLINHPPQQQQQQQGYCYTRNQEFNIPIHVNHMQTAANLHQRQPFTAMNFNSQQQPFRENLGYVSMRNEMHSHQMNINAGGNQPIQPRKKCRYVAQGRWCPFGDRCKFSHESA